MTKRYKLLFLCTGNSARSILGEYILRKMAGERFETFSAGAQPTGRVNPRVVDYLRRIWDIDASDARSKSWEEFNDCPLDFVITVCDNAQQTCPVWPGQPVIAHWGLPDPAAIQDEREQDELIRKVGAALKRRIELLASLPIEKLDRLKLQHKLDHIGTGDEAPVAAA